MGTSEKKILSMPEIHSSQINRNEIASLDVSDRWHEIYSTRAEKTSSREDLQSARSRARPIQTKGNLRDVCWWFVVRDSIVLNVVVGERYSWMIGIVLVYN